MIAWQLIFLVTFSVPDDLKEASLISIV